MPRQVFEHLLLEFNCREYLRRLVCMSLDGWPLLDQLSTTVQFVPSRLLSQVNGNDPEITRMLHVVLLVYYVSKLESVDKRL